MKRILKLIMFFSVIAGNVFSQNAFIVADTNVPQGGQGEMIVNYQFAEEGSIVAYSFALELPDGISLVPNGQSFAYEKGDGYNISQRISINYVEEENLYYIGCVSLTSTVPFSETSGKLITLPLQADASVTQGDVLDAALKNVRLSTIGGSNIALDEVSFHIVIGQKVRVLLDENDMSAPASSEGVAVDILVRRTIKANEWSTICLPFSMTAEQIEAAFPETTVQLADFIGCGEPVLDDEKEVMNFSFNFSTNVTEIEPNHPYLIKVDKKVESFDVDGVTITPSDELNVDKDEIKWRQGGRWYYDYNSFIGTYEAQTEVPEDCLFLSGNKFWYSTGATKMKAFRGYFYSYNILGDAYKNATNSNVLLTFNDAEGIVNVKVGPLPTKETYDLQGRKVSGSLKRGVYIIDGKKIVVK